MAFRRIAALAAALAAALLVAAMVPVASAQAAGQTVQVTLSDKQPADVTITAGDRVVFANAENAPVGGTHQVTSAPGGSAWTYDSGKLAPGQPSAPVQFPQPGSFRYTDARTLGPAPANNFTAKVVVKPAPAAAAPPPASTAPAGASATASSGRPATTAPAPAGARGTPGSGSGSTPPSSFAGTPALPSGPPAMADAVPPAVAPMFGTPSAPVTSAPAVGATAGAATTTALPPIQAVPGPLPGTPAARGLGLAATLAAVAVAGAFSLLVRVLLAEPVAGRRPASAAAQRAPGSVSQPAFEPAHHAAR